MNLPHLLPVWLVCFIVSPTLAGCFYLAPEAPNTEQPLVIGVSPWVGYAPLYLARELGLLEGQGIELVEYPIGDPQRTVDFKQQKIVAETTNIEDVLTLTHQPNLPFALLLVTSISQGADALLGRPHITAIQQLRGRRIALGNEGYLDLYLLNRALEKNAMSMRDVVVVDMPSTQKEEAYFADQVEAVVAFDPIRTRLLRAGAREIFSSRELPDEIIDIIIVNRHYLRTHPANVRNLLRIWFKSLDYLKENPLDSAKKLAPVFKMRQSDLLNGFALVQFPSANKNYDLMQDDSPELLTAIDLFQELLLERNLLAAPVNTENLLVSEAELTQGLSTPSATAAQTIP